MAAPAKAQPSNRQVIYIDAQDDIASLIEVVEKADKRIVVLVLPKRPEVLSSVVNMKLLRESGLQFDKKIVLVTTDRAILAIAANVKLPVAATLSSQPVIPDPDAMIDEPAEDQPTASTVVQPGPTDQPKPVAKSIKVPNFSRFVKRLLLIATGLTLIVVAWLVAFRILPQAEIQIETNLEVIEDIVLEVTLSPEASRLNIEQKIVPFHLDTKDHELTETVNASGEKRVGVQASGLIKLTNCTDAAVTIPAGTILVADGLTYTNQQEVSLEGGNFNSSGDCKSLGDHAKTVTINATEVGEQYNFTGFRVYALPDGFSGKITAETTDLVDGPSPIAGGSDEIVNYITQVDLDQANSQLALQRSDDTIKSNLQQQLIRSNLIPLNDTFMVDIIETEADVVVDQEADSGLLTQQLSYSLGGVSSDDIKVLLHPLIESQANGLALVDDGLSSAQFTLKIIDDDLYQLKIAVIAQVGSTLVEADVFNQIKGLPAKEVSESLRQQDGIVNVQIKLSPPWINNIPTDINKVKIEIINDD